MGGYYAGFVKKRDKIQCSRNIVKKKKTIKNQSASIKNSNLKRSEGERRTFQGPGIKEDGIIRGLFGFTGEYSGFVAWRWFCAFPPSPKKKKKKEYKKKKKKKPLKYYGTVSPSHFYYRICNVWRVCRCIPLCFSACSTPTLGACMWKTSCSSECVSLLSQGSLCVSFLQCESGLLTVPRS